MWRLLPHPHYGNWGGGNNGNGKKPIDIMDSYFRKHDTLLKRASSKQERIKADIILVRDLKKISNKSLKRPIYGRLYKYGTIFIFTILNSINSCLYL